MPLIPVARRAIIDAVSGAVHFLMKDGAKTVLIRVTASLGEGARGHSGAVSESERFAAFKLQRKRVERAASLKYSRRRIEDDGSVILADDDIDHADALLNCDAIIDGSGPHEAAVETFYRLAKGRY